VPYTPEVLMAHVLRHVVRHVSTEEDRPPSEVVLTHPANFGPFKLDLMREVARQADIADVRLLAEPQAAALSYAQRSAIEPGTTVAVYDFGGGTFDVALVHRDADGTFRLLGSPEGMDRLGGIDFDQAILAKVVDDVGLSDQLADADLTQTDPTVLGALTDLRDRCREAKEALSNDVDAAIAVNLPGVQTNVRLTRAEFESLIRPRVVETVESLQRVIRNSGVATTDIDRVLLVGGSSRIPLVAEMVRSITSRPVALDANPKNAICQGAALHRVTTMPPLPAGLPSPTTANAAAPQPPGTGTTYAATKQRSRNLLVGAGVAAALGLGAVAFVATRGGDDPPAAGSATTAVPVESIAPAPTIITVEDAPLPSSTEPQPTDTTVPQAQTVTFDGEWVGRSVTFGPLTREIVSIQASNQNFDEANDVASTWMLRVNVREKNALTSQAGSGFDAYTLILGDGTEVPSSVVNIPFADAEATVTGFINFDLRNTPYKNVPPTAEILTGGILRIGGDEATKTAILLTGEQPPEIVPEPVPVGEAVVFSQSLETEEWRADTVLVTLNNSFAPSTGTTQAHDERAVEGSVFVVVDFTVTCQVGPGGCGFWAENARLSVDGELFGQDSEDRDSTPVLTAGTSGSLTIIFEVPVGSDYQLVIGPPDGTTSNIALPIAELAAALQASAAVFNE
jgi:actin-like ATPase involved in cell morphogenesis